MESDLPLMELAEVDDSLIQPFPDPNQTPSKSPFNYFTCSPLALPPSRTKSLKDSVHTQKPSSSSSEASNNKENINSNSIEMPKLGMGPIQMKRKKKGGECNLRKSLAWDRAFFTDEGILDPRELNLITGINSYTCGRGLPSISEEGNSSYSSSRKCRNEPNDTESSKEALLKELRDKSRTPKGNRVVTHKVLSSGHSNRAVSKVGGCSEPSTASSLKRPNSNTLRTSKKEFKLPKLPISKPGSCSSAITRSSITASQMRQNLIPKPSINAQKNVGLKSSLKDMHSFQSKAKTGPDSLCLPAKEPAQKAVRNLTQTNTSFKATSSTKSHVVRVAKSGLEMVSDRLQSCEIQDESTPQSLAQLTPTTLNVPSGLRLPSPSLRFFDQTTTSDSVSLQQKRIQQSTRQSGELAALPSPTPRTPSGGTQMSPSSSYIVNTAKRVTDSNIYSDIVRKIMLREDISESHEVIEQKGKMGMEKIALKGDDEVKVSRYGEGIEEKLDNYTATLVSTCGESFQHQEHNIGQSQTSKGQTEDPVSDVIVDRKDDYSVLLQDRKTGQENDGKSLLMEDDDATRITDTRKIKDEVNLPVTSIKSKVELQEDQSATCFETTVFLKEGPRASLTEIQDYPTQEKNGLDLGSEVQLECKDIVSLIDDENQSTLSKLRPEFEEVMNGTESMSDNAILETFSESLLEITSTEFKIDEEKQKHQEMQINSGDKSEESIVDGSVSCCKGVDKLNEPQGFVGIMTSVETTNHFTVSQQSTTTSTSVIPESCLVVKEAEGSKKQVKAQILQQGKNKNATVLVERSDEMGRKEDNSLVIHPPNAFDDTLEDIESFVEDQAQTSKTSYGEEVRAQVPQEEKSKDTAVSMKRSNTIKRQDNSLVIQAVPFSDEWLAAIEAAGEEILTMKCGAVQHSPPDKSIPERSPWSPVKSKANQIGPYDCTKCTNAMPSNPHLLDQ